jgi:hypothetical protein
MFDWIARFILGVGSQPPSRTAWDQMTSWERRDILFKNIAQIFGALAIIVGGIWALYHFYLVESNDAIVDRERRLVNNQRYGLEINISADSKRDHGCLISGVVKIKNIGSDILMATKRKGSKKYLQVLLIGGSYNNLKIENVDDKFIWADWNQTEGRLDLPLTPGLERSFPFYVQASRPGLFDIRFNADLKAYGSGKYIAPAVGRFSYRACGY